MISQQDLIPWRTVAPWSTDLMVEQDYLLCQAVELIFKNPKLSSQLAMRGGTVLHKGHLAPASRYSEDIDLVLRADRSHAGIQDDIAVVIAPLLGEPSESVITNVRLTIRNLLFKSKIARLTYVYDPTSQQEEALPTLKIEVNLNEKGTCYPLTSVDIEVPSPSGPVKVPVVSYDLDEMLGTKLRALVQRDKGRDLFDLWYAWTCSQRPGASAKVDPARVAHAFRFYLQQESSPFKKAHLEVELARRMKSRKFLRDMDGYLPVGIEYDPKKAYDEFHAVFMPHL